MAAKVAPASTSVPTDVPQAAQSVIQSSVVGGPIGASVGAFLRYRESGDRSQRTSYPGDFREVPLPLSGPALRNGDPVVKRPPGCETATRLRRRPVSSCNSAGNQVIQPSPVGRSDGRRPDRRRPDRRRQNSRLVCDRTAHATGNHPTASLLVFALGRATRGWRLAARHSTWPLAHGGARRPLLPPAFVGTAHLVRR